jgi:alpha-amylase
MALTLLFVGGYTPHVARANPWNGKVVLQAFWWDVRNDAYPHGWYTYLAKLAPRLRRLGFDGIWIPPPSKGNSGGFSMGYDVFDHYDLGEKDQKGSVATRFGNQDELLRLVAVAHANGLEVYPDIVLNHTIGGREDPDAPGDKFKRFRYRGFGGSDDGRWPKDHPDFHPNPGHQCTDGDICEQKFGPDICYRDPDHGGGESGKYMRDQARAWLVWLKKQTGADGFRFDAVKHYEAYVVEDLLFNAMGPRNEYFCVGEFLGSKDQLDGWVAATQDRCGTFDFPLREGLAAIVESGGFFDMGSLPNLQQGNRRKTAPFVNNHDTWRGSFWDSKPGSTAHDDRDGDFRQNGDELAPTIDPDNPRADVAYAAAFAVDGSPVVFYEDLFRNFAPDRFAADPERIATRDYVVNLVWSHQKLDFKDGAYRVPFQGSQDLLVIERAGKALIGLNDSGNEMLTAGVRTSFGPHVRLHDYSGSNLDDVTTDGDGRVTVSVPPMSYAVWGPAGISGGFDPPARRTTQEFQLDDDLGDAQPSSLGYGGKITSAAFHTAGAIWAAANTRVKVSVFTDGARKVELRVATPDAHGGKSTSSGKHGISGQATNDAPLELEFTAAREGYHQLAARLADSSEQPTRAYVKVEYEAPARSQLIEP